MKKITIDWVKSNNLLIYEVIVGSKAYGLDNAASDTDIKGVFILPKKIYYSLDYCDQVSNDTNDIVYYELKRFMELLSKSNPNILEMLAVPDKCILYKHELMNSLNPFIFLSKQCEKSFANYAYTQVKKAFGLEKKIVNPMAQERKNILDFCFVYKGKEAIQLSVYLEENKIAQEQIGLSVIPHLRNCYNMHYSACFQYAGIMRKESANDITLSSIPKTEQVKGMMYFNKDGYSIYCKQFREYWEWVEKRNETRYNTTLSHGKKYDSKNMMHVFRLLLVAKEIAIEHKLNVFRQDREYLLEIKQGKYEYDELVLKAEALKRELNGLYRDSNLPDAPDIDTINQQLVEMREKYYAEK
jgi:predicted nucleotidyltransferase